MFRLTKKKEIYDPYDETLFNLFCENVIISYEIADQRLTDNEIKKIISKMLK